MSELFFGKRGRGKSLLRKLVVVLLLLAAASILIDFKIRPVIKTMALNNGKIRGVTAIHQAMAQELGDEEARYYDLVNISTDERGNVKSISADVIKLNRLKAAVNDTVQQRLMPERNEFSIRLGTLLGNELLQGRGPDVPLKMTMTDYVVSDFASEFTEAGVNQTRHRIMLTISVHITVYLPGYIASDRVETGFCVAETVIVGEIPENYTYVTGDNSDIISKVNDYPLQ